MTTGTRHKHKNNSNTFSVWNWSLRQGQFNILLNTVRKWQHFTSPIHVLQKIKQVCLNWSSDHTNYDYFNFRQWINIMENKQHEWPALFGNYAHKWPCTMLTDAVKKGPNVKFAYYTPTTHAITLDGAGFKIWMFRMKFILLRISSL